MTPTPISELKTGDVVHTRGLRVELLGRTEWEQSLSLYGQVTRATVIRFEGKVLNPEVFRDEPARRIFSGMVDFSDPHWAVQSVSWAMWNKED